MKKITRQMNRSTGFTLIELLVVMLIIVILSGITFSVSKYVSWRARTARADVERHKIRTALDEYRAVYGEYPIVGDPDHSGHYPINLPIDEGTRSNLPPYLWFLNLTTTNAKGQIGVEYLPLRSEQYVDYRLTYPLKLRPESEGRPPFMDFPLMTIGYVVYKTTTRETSSMDVLGRIHYYLIGDPVNRLKAVEPVSGHQWHYECSNGTTYTLSTWGW